MDEILRAYFGHEAFRQGQRELIDNILLGRDVLGVMPTGAGKSVCYQVPALMLEGITLVVSPLISLMKDQVSALIQIGIKAAYINSTLSFEESDQVYFNAKKGAYDIIYVAPERLGTNAFLQFAEQVKIAMVTVDEAHCVSQWGQDFRPSYLKIMTFINNLSYRPIVSAFTATATEAIRKDIVDMLSLQDPFKITTGFNRENLYFEVRHPNKKMAALLEIVKRNKDKSGIIYCSTRKAVEKVCLKLDEAGYSATRYHAGLGDRERHKNQEDFLFDRKNIMVATNAFGMGIDKSNVSFVVHYNMPKNIESYYQEAGRAGRDGEPAQCILLYSGQDVRTNQFLIENSREQNEDMPSDVLEAVIAKDKERLKVMTFYSTTTDCLRGYILNYFGEKGTTYCGDCSNCNTHFETVDITVEAQKILSCVYRVQEIYRPLGKTMITSILRGSKNEKVKRIGLDGLSTYNIMADVPAHRIQKMMDFLLEKQYMSLTDDEYPMLTLSETSIDVLKGREKIEMKLPKTIKMSKDEAPIHDVNEGLFQQLKDLRNALASKARVPAYIVFTDASLRDMCRKLPVDNEAFLDVSGVGEAKKDRYGTIFTEVIKTYVAVN